LLLCVILFVVEMLAMSHIFPSDLFRKVGRVQGLTHNIQALITFI